ncbi:Gfo/Idh/MocA family protein [Rhizobium sp. YIM 134829]|uniref:Gfo/Idh/MocA family protein n=1 Tax=Rhizobium sp. YIM 134829 TaxID=3390453 RepID=UPI003978B985
MHASRQWRAGIIGLGMAAPPHVESLRDLRDRVTVAGTYSPSVARRQAFHERYGLPVVESADALFDDPSIDYLIILTPPASHLELVRRAAKRGKPVLLEKPLEVTLARSKELVAVAAAIPLIVCFQRRFRRSFIETARLVADGALGEIVSATLQLRNWRPQSYYDEPGRGTLARDGGGVLLTQAIHLIDQFIALVGLPSAVTAFTGTSAIHRMETEDLVHAALRLRNGGIGALSATTAAFPGLPDRIELFGTKGSAVLEGETARIRLMDGRTIDIEDDSEAGGTSADPMAFSHHNHRRLHEDILTALDVSHPPTITAADALNAHLLIDALLRSSDLGETVLVEQDHR